MLKSTLLYPVEKTIQFILQRDPTSAQRLAALEDKVVALSITDLNFKFFWVFENQQVRLLPEWSREVDVIIEAPFNALAKIGLKQTTKDVTISGDLRTVETFKALFSELDIDWEEQLAPFVGDGLAFKLGDVARKATNFFKEAAVSLRANAKDYLHEESQVVAPRERFTDFTQDVRDLNRQLNQLASRVEQLRSRRA